MNVGKVDTQDKPIIKFDTERKFADNFVNFINNRDTLHCSSFTSKEFISYLIKNDTSFANDSTKNALLEKLTNDFDGFFNYYMKDVYMNIFNKIWNKTLDSKTFVIDSFYCTNDKVQLYYGLQECYLSIFLHNSKKEHFELKIMSLIKYKDSWLLDRPVFFFGSVH